MKMYKIVDPVFDDTGKLINSVETIRSEQEIIDLYYPYWQTRMIKAKKQSLISRERCIEDYIIINFAEEV